MPLSISFCGLKTRSATLTKCLGPIGLLGGEREDTTSIKLVIANLNIKRWDIVRFPMELRCGIIVHDAGPFCIRSLGYLNGNGAIWE